MKNVQSEAKRHPPRFAYVRTVRNQVQRHWFDTQAEAAARLADEVKQHAGNPRITPLRVESSTGEVLKTAADCAPAPAKQKGDK